MTVRLRCAVLPSLQDTNVFAGADGKQTNEMVQMSRLADQLLAVNGQTSGTSGIWMRKFTGKAYSDGDWRANLVAQQQAARAWLSPGDGPTVALNLHTDSGTFSHLGYYYDGRAVGSRELAKHLAWSLVPIWSHLVPIDGRDMLSADYGAQEYYFCKEMVEPDGSRPHHPVLLEIGSHQVAGDTKLVAERGEDIAKAIVDGLVWVFKLPTVPPEVVWDKDAIRAGVAKLKQDVAALEALLK